ncbi:MAG: EF-hand domain-containing protein [Planctomycetes bacterium]|nr:EF-hand domain-containing protein [Planctomycetota bacterium]
MKTALLVVISGILIPILVFGGRRANGEDVQANALVAHSRMQQLNHAALIYLNDNEEFFDDPLRLIDSGLVQPITFWHPGDSDPAPTTIDNSFPNQTNSTQISFLFRTGDYSNVVGDEFVIWDNSPTNNAGQFFSMVTLDGLIETIPPAATPVPTKVTLAQAHLKRLAIAAIIYTNGNEKFFPDDVIRLYSNGDIKSPRSFWNPGDSDPLPTDITNSVPNGAESAQVSFEYLLAGLTEDGLPGDTIAFRDNSPDNNAGLGINVARVNGVVELVLSGTVGDADQNGSIDLADWAKFQRCFGGWSVTVVDDTCRLVDFNRNGSIDIGDFEAFTGVMQGP